MSALEETFGATGTLQRETKGEVVLVSRLRAALERLNPALPPEAITAAVDELTRDRSAMSLEAGEPRGLSAAQGRHQGFRAGPASAAGRRPSGCA